MKIRLPDQVILNLEIFQQEFRLETVIRRNSADLCGGNHHIFRLFRVIKRLDLTLIPQIQLLMRARQEIAITVFLKTAQNRAADHSPVSCDENPGILCNHFNMPPASRRAPGADRFPP